MPYQGCRAIEEAVASTTASFDIIPIRWGIPSFYSLKLGVAPAGSVLLQSLSLAPRTESEIHMNSHGCSSTQILSIKDIHTFLRTSLGATVWHVIIELN